MNTSDGSLESGGGFSMTIQEATNTGVQDPEPTKKAKSLQVKVVEAWAERIAHELPQAVVAKR
jgi:hypothetical protein